MASARDDRSGSGQAGIGVSMASIKIPATWARRVRSQAILA
ncbi:hypothetical protein [Lamprocystis purpurea]|nr:hypothetical protein [Lamprocystis purpurea]